MSTTALSVIESKNFIALDPTNERMVAIKANLEASGESMGPGDLIRVKTPSSGGVNWQVPTISGEESVPVLRGVMVFYHAVGVLWGSFDPKQGEQPVLRTFDLRTAEQVGNIPDSMLDVLGRFRMSGNPEDAGYKLFPWMDLPYNQWGSGKDGIGKRCKEQRLIGLLRENDPFPMMLTVQPGSLKTMTGFIKKLAFQCPYWRAVVELKLEKQVSKGGQVYSRIIPSLVGVLSEDDGLRVKREYTDVMERMLNRIDIDTDNGGGEE